ncbi:MAG: hypothetical protein WA945_00380 [Arcobacteraceae bacterium]
MVIIVQDVAEKSLLGFLGIKEIITADFVMKSILNSLLVAAAIKIIMY